MKDEKIIELFLLRDGRALEEVDKKYGDLIYYIASNFLALREDREECVNDVYLALWNSIPPTEPASLSAYISEITRHQAMKKSRANNAWKRGGQVKIVNEELLSLLDDGTDLSELYESRRAGELISKFLRSLGEGDRQIFLMRYFFDMSPRDIAKQMHCGESAIKMRLLRTRKKLAEYIVSAKPIYRVSTYRAEGISRAVRRRRYSFIPLHIDKAQ